jgi:hypothetical protein
MGICFWIKFVVLNAGVVTMVGRFALKNVQQVCSSVPWNMWQHDPGLI